jgi:hypothetical protein
MSPGANPTTFSYNASAVKMYNAKDSIARIWYKNYYFYFKTHLPFYNSGVVVVKSNDVGLAPEDGSFFQNMFFLTNLQLNKISATN